MEVYIPTSKKELSLRKKQAYSEFSKVINWGRGNPIKFCEVMFGIRLMDYQAYAFLNTWNRPYAAWLMCRAAGKTVLASAYFMAKTLLIPNYTVYIVATKSEQAITSFQKLEDIAMNRIPSFRGLTDIFRNELQTSPGNNGFGHKPAGYSFKLFNGSQVRTLSSNVKGNRGYRGGAWYDEAGFIPKELTDVCDQFANVDSNFSLDVGLNLQRPRQMPLQLLYTSSAGPVNMPFYNKFKAYTMHMLAGDRNYWTCDFDVDLIMDHSSVNGIPITSHLSKERIEGDIKDNPEAAEMELFNHFRRGAGKHAVVTEDCLVRNSFTRIPVFKNDTGKRKFIFCYDPARNYDNSILAIFELLHDSKVGYYLDLVNVISMVNTQSEKKTPLNYVEQLKIIKQAMIDYNGPEAAEWENIEFYIDAGAGGSPRSGIADQLLLAWKDSAGVEHRGVIDPDDPNYASDRKNYPGNARIVHLIEPTKYKSKMFGALAEMADLNLIHFTDYDGHRDYLTMLKKKDGEEFYDQYKLSLKEKQALIQIELTKTEISYMCRFDTQSGGARYELVRERRYRMHDDRAYALAMGAYALWKIRNNELRTSQKGETEALCFKGRAPKWKTGKEVDYVENISRRRCV